jgi:hypothetical protein
MLEGAMLKLPSFGDIHDNFKMKFDNSDTEDGKVPEPNKVLIGGKAFDANAKGIKQFGDYKAELVGSQKPIMVNGIDAVPHNSPMGKALLMEAELQLVHGASPEQARTVAAEAFGLNPADLPSEITETQLIDAMNREVESARPKNVEAMQAPGQNSGDTQTEANMGDQKSDKGWRDKGPVNEGSKQTFDSPRGQVKGK